MHSILIIAQKTKVNSGDNDLVFDSKGYPHEIFPETAQMRQYNHVLDKSVLG